MNNSRIISSESHRFFKLFFHNKKDICIWIILYLTLIFVKPCMAERVPNTFINKITELYANLPHGIERAHGFTVNFEKNNQIGVAWFCINDSLEGLRGCWAFNYIRFDTAGKIIVDFRKFAVKNMLMGNFNFLADPYDPMPKINYKTDGGGNSIIAYNYADEKPEAWRLAWLKVDSLSNSCNNDFDGISVGNAIKGIQICLSKKYGFHIINAGNYRLSDKSKKVNFLNYAFSYWEKKPHLMPPWHFIETSDNNLLCLSELYDSMEIHYQRISPKGKFLSGARAKIKKVTSIIWDNIELPGCKELFHWNDSIWYITTQPSRHFRGQNRLFLIVFDKKGKIIQRKAEIKTRLLAIDSLPIDSKRFIKISKDVIYYFGFDHQGNIYYWNSKWGYIDYNRADIFAPFYSIHYNNVKDSIYNPSTENNIYPDSMTWPFQWSKGGKLKHNMKLLIGFNKQNKTYTIGELIGIRCGIIHAIMDNNIYLAKALYSPNKHNCLPEITVHINAPADVVKGKMNLGYMGDDVILIPRPKVDSVEVPVGRIFNPSPDNLFYNMWAGIYKFDTPGVYRISCSYTFDSLTSSIKVPGIDTLFSDTVEIIVNAK